MFFTPSNDMNGAACASLPEAEKRKFFDGTGGRRMKMVCKKCPVMDECLDMALDFENQPGAYKRWGTWGGMTADERDEVYGKLSDVHEEVRRPLWEVSA